MTLAPERIDTRSGRLTGPARVALAREASRYLEARDPVGHCSGKYFSFAKLGRDIISCRCLIEHLLTQLDRSLMSRLIRWRRSPATPAEISDHLGSSAALPVSIHRHRSRVTPAEISVHRGGGPALLGLRHSHRRLGGIARRAWHHPIPRDTPAAAPVPLPRDCTCFSTHLRFCGILG